MGSDDWPVAGNDLISDAKNFDPSDRFPARCKLKGMYACAQYFGFPFAVPRLVYFNLTFHNCNNVTANTSTYIVEDECDNYTVKDFGSRAIEVQAFQDEGF